MKMHIAAAFIVLATMACEPDGQIANGLGTQLRDSAGIRITTSDAADRSASTVCSLAEAPDTRVASPSSGEWTLFEVEDLGRLEDGRLVVLNRSSRQLLMFGRDGEFLRSVGRRGEGPGEFVDPIELGVIGGDSIVVWDWGLGRLVLFGADGSHGRSVRLQPPVVNPTGRVGVARQGIAVGSHDLRPFDMQLTPAVPAGPSVRLERHAGRHAGDTAVWGTGACRSRVRDDG